jgi:hypothetical protein
MSLRSVAGGAIVRRDLNQPVEWGFAGIDVFIEDAVQHQRRGQFDGAHGRPARGIASDD